MTHTQAYVVTDNSGSFTGRGWRLSGPDGFEVFPDHQKDLAEQFAKAKNSAHAAAMNTHPALLAERDALREACRHMVMRCDECNGTGIAMMSEDMPCSTCSGARAALGEGGGA